MKLLCSVCCFVHEKPNEALMVITGYSVCEEHMGLVAGNSGFASILHIARDMKAGKVSDGA